MAASAHAAPIEPPDGLKRFFASLHYIARESHLLLKQLHDCMILIGMILITALAIWGLWKQNPQYKSAPEPHTTQQRILDYRL